MGREGRQIDLYAADFDVIDGVNLGMGADFESVKARVAGLEIRAHHVREVLGAGVVDFDRPDLAQ